MALDLKRMLRRGGLGDRTVGNAREEKVGVGLGWRVGGARQMKTNDCRFGVALKPEGGGAG